MSKSYWILHSVLRRTREKDMNHRERFFAAVNHQETDRPPMDFVCEPWMRQKLAEYLGQPDFESALRQLDTDLRQLHNRDFQPQPEKDESGAFTDIWGVRRRPVFNQFGSYDEVEFRPCEDMDNMEQLEDYLCPSVGINDFSELESLCREYHDYVVVFGSPAIMDVINGTAYARGYERLLMDIALEDPVGITLMEKRFQFTYDSAEMALKAANGLIDVLWVGDDYGTQNGPLVGIDTWKKIFAPMLRAFIDLGHNYGAKVMFHSCGSNRHLIPAWIEMGLDIYQTVQPEAEGMESIGLFRDFGKEITFHGMMGLQSALRFGTPDDVRREVDSRIEASQGSGWILAPSHNFQPDVPMANIQAMYQYGARASAK